MESYIIKRYLNEERNEKTYEDICERLSEEQPSIYTYLLQKKFIPAGRTLCYFNTTHELAPNCVTIDLHDDLTNIFDTMNRLMQLTRIGSGIGVNLSLLRPAGTICKHYGAISSGPISFLNMFSVVMRTIQQQSRHGAFIGLLDIYHPDILNFIEVKQNLQIINNFNLSVIIDDDFMFNVYNHPDKIVTAKYNTTHNDGTTTTVNEFHYITYDNNFVLQDVSPVTITYKELFDDIVSCAWKTGEPGIIFKGNVNHDNTLQYYLGDIVHCNPCGEQSMYPNECCNLGSINLSKFVETLYINPLEEYTVNELFEKYFHKEDFIKCVREAVTFLNNIVDKIETNDEKINKMVRATRRIGLGMMGLHDMLIKIRIPYDSDSALSFVTLVVKLLKETAYEKSYELMKDYGSVGKRLFEYSIVTNDAILTDLKNNNRCNVTLLTVAPNGSTSMLANVSSGIEPYYSLGYKRFVDNGKTESDVIINPRLLEYLSYINHNNKDDIDYIITNGIESVDYIPKYMKEVFKTAQYISPERHVLMQATIQKYIDNSISKTINLPESASKKDIYNTIMLAHTLGIKGMTVYRNNSRLNVINDMKLSKDNCKNGNCDM